MVAVEATLAKVSRGWQLRAGGMLCCALARELKARRLGRTGNVVSLTRTRR
jgi:hypothetical protein